MSRSDVVTNIRPSLSLSTLLMRSRAVSSCAEASQTTSLPAPDLGFAALPRPLAAGAEADFSSALVSTAEMVHLRRKPYISSRFLWCGIASWSSASRSAWMMSACVDKAEVMRSRILLRMAGGICDECLDSRNRLLLGSLSYVLVSFGYAGTHFKRNCSVSNTELRVIASGLSATASTTGFSSLLINPGDDSDSGSSSQSCSACGASGVGISAGSLSNSLTASLMSKSTRSSMMFRVAWGNQESETRSDEMSAGVGWGCLRGESEDAAATVAPAPKARGCLLARALCHQYAPFGLARQGPTRLPSTPRTRFAHRPTQLHKPPLQWQRHAHHCAMQRPSTFMRTT